MIQYSNKVKNRILINKKSRLNLPIRFFCEQISKIDEVKQEGKILTEAMPLSDGAKYTQLIGNLSKDYKAQIVEKHKRYYFKWKL
jgi:hypothetical protein